MDNKKSKSSLTECLDSSDEMLEVQYSFELRKASCPPERIVQEMVNTLLDDEHAACEIQEYANLFEFIRERLRNNDMPLTTLMDLRKMYGEPKERAEQIREKIVQEFLKGKDQDDD